MLYNIYCGYPALLGLAPPVIEWRTSAQDSWKEQTPGPSLPGERPHDVFVCVLARPLHVCLPCFCIENARNSKNFQCRNTGDACVMRGFMRARGRRVAAPIEGKPGTIIGPAAPRPVCPKVSFYIFFRKKSFTDDFCASCQQILTPSILFLVFYNYKSG